MYRAMFWFSPSPHPVDNVTLQFQHSTLPLSLMLYCAVWIGQLLYKKYSNSIAARFSSASVPNAQVVQIGKFASWLEPSRLIKVGCYMTATCLLVAFASPCASPFIYFSF
jgi:hypothetical protein